MLDPPLFPYRPIYKVGETGDLAQRALARWVRGGRFHKYGPLRWEQPDWEPGEDDGRLDFHGVLDGSRVRWTVSFERAGEHENTGFSCGYSSAEDAAYSACERIEAREREAYEEALVVGVA